MLPNATLVDAAAPPSPAQVTNDIRSEQRLAEIMLPVVLTGTDGTRLDHTHRFFREDIGEGLSYILSIARRTGVARYIDTDRDVGEFRHGQIDRIAEHLRAGRNHH